MGKIKIIKPGLFTTVQDRGRYGFQQSGVSSCGAMDLYAYRAANLLLRSENSAVLEISLLGPEIEIMADTAIAITGAEMKPLLNGTAMPMWESVIAFKGSVLTFSGLISGARSYLAVGGGISTAPVMGSRSTDIKAGIGGLKGSKLMAGDIIEIEPWDLTAPLKALSKEAVPKYTKNQKIRVIPGPQYDYFTEKGIHTFFKSTYTVSGQFDRMGYRLEGNEIESKNGSDIISDGISVGSIQIPGSGKPIILMADRQTAGGYAKIGAVASADLYKIAQAKEGDTFEFIEITVEEGQRLLKEQDELLRKSIYTKGNTSPAEAVSPNAKQYKLLINNKEYFVTVNEL